MTNNIIDVDKEFCCIDDDSHPSGNPQHLNSQGVKIPHQHTDYDTYGISDVIDRATWVMLDEQTRNNIRVYATAKNRPSSIDKNLWDELSSNDRAHVIEKKNIMKSEIERPEEICASTWSKLNINTKSAIVDKLHNLRPPGFDSTLWKSLSDLTRKSITDDLYGHDANIDSEKNPKLSHQIFRFINKRIDNCFRQDLSSTYRWWLLRLTTHSRVVTFFFSGVHVIEDPDAGIGAMVLVCALILTIPFGTFSYVNPQFLSNLSTALLACPDEKSYSGESYGQIHDRMTASLSACMYFSLMGLIISSVYYVFKPLPGKGIDRWCRLQGRILMLSLFIVTAAAISSLMSLGLYLLEYSSQESIDICTFHANPSYETGIAGIVLSFVIALACMW